MTLPGDVSDGIPMGIGKLGDPNVTFVRKFRWTLAGKHFDESWVKKVTINHEDDTIDVEIYDVILEGKVPTLDFLDYMDKNIEELVFITYDGCGIALYKHIFMDVTLEKMHVSNLSLSCAL